eukprot:m.353531 g.353531  ORF g.353531 m.353531 type:complete len:1151 (+) comp16786_c0_seq1:587-4039(+)
MSDETKGSAVGTAEQQSNGSTSDSQSGAQVANGQPSDSTAVTVEEPTFMEIIPDMVELKDKDQLASLGGRDGIVQEVNANLTDGLDEATVLANRERFGENRLPDIGYKGFWRLVLEALQDKTLIMLLIAAIISLAIGIATEGAKTGWKDGVAVIIAVIVVVAITSVNDYQKEKQFRALNAVKNDHPVTVVRHGDTIRISVYDIVVGDLVVLDTNETIPADGLFVKGESMQTDESSATGESKLIKKGEGDEVEPFFLSGTQVAGGKGTMLVIATGVHSFNGKIMMSLRTESSDTPLQEKLAKLADLVGNFGVITAVLIFVVQLIKYFAIEGKDVDRKEAAKNAIDFLVIAISIVVVAVPEGLPLAVTISLAYSMKNMMKDNNLVRHLDACETMGGATTVCSDKTGTLTQNKMKVVEGRILNHWFGADDGIPFPADSSKAGASDVLDNNGLQLAYNGLALNSTAYETKDSEGTVSFVGSKTETALLTFLKDQGVDYTAKRDEHHVSEWFPFSSARKRMCCSIPTAGSSLESEGQYVLHVKGAADILLSMCSTFVDKDGSVKELDGGAREEFEQTLTNMGAKALRCIAFCYRTGAEPVDYTAEPEPQLTLIGLVGIQDPLRPEIKDAVRTCQKAGVVVRMVTGDATAIAQSIAKSCGIFDEAEGHLCLEGPSFRTMSDEELIPLLPKLRILARSSPTDKLKLVSALQSLGEVVAVTGDGVNDGPALKKADVGFAMGLSGTEVAKEASAIVLLDDNFASIVNAIKWGRSVFDNIRKFLQFQLTVNFTAILVLLIAVLADKEGSAENAPLKPVQLLWINLIMDSFAALALATEKPTEKLLKFKPYDRDEPLITTFMIRRISTQVVLQTVTLLLILYIGTSWFDTEQPIGALHAFSHEHQTVIFNVFVLSALVNQLNSRKLRGELNIFAGLSTHWIFVAVWFFSLAIQILIVQFGGNALETAPLNGKQWGYCILFALLPIAWATFFNMLPFSWKHGDPEKQRAQAKKRREKKREKALKKAAKKAAKKEAKERAAAIAAGEIVEDGTDGDTVEQQEEAAQAPVDIDAVLKAEAAPVLKFPLTPGESDTDLTGTDATHPPGDMPVVVDTAVDALASSASDDDDDDDEDQVPPQGRFRAATLAIMTQLAVVDALRRKHR